MLSLAPRSNIKLTLVNQQEVNEVKSYVLISTIVLSFLICSLAMSADWGILMIDLGQKDTSKGVLILPSGGDGVHEPDTIGGRDCRSIPKIPGADTGNHAYFNVDSAVVQNKADSANVWIGIEFFDKPETGSTGILMDYDDKGDAYPDNAFALTLPTAGRTISFLGTGKWKIAIIAIDQAQFKQQGNGADFRIHIVPYKSGKLSLDHVWISNKAFKESDVTGGASAVSNSGKLAITWGKVKDSN